ncbi:hypothetical protein LQT97_09650 [Brucella pseudogrignonensis]|uniref:hypothetical protein n=1 Tax=Brucella pseudogrignonensis TaxID=419475 RepID=UPI001E4C282A|nr:hypothetical protein [Brucella pseudogrignonensis]MCD4511501.1 hypothetical protein [Brucella pseudogrignonensis]
MKPTHAQGVQLVWFPARQEIMAADRIFEAIFARSPESVNTNRVPSPSAPFLSQAKSLIDGLIHTVVIEPGRVSVTIQPNHDVPIASPLQSSPVPFVGFDEVWKIVGGVLEKLSKEFVEPSVRVAIILGTSYLAENGAEANKLFTLATGIETSEDTLDLIYQRNDRLIVNDVAFNRLENYSVNNVEWVQMQPIWQGAMNFNPIQNQVARSSFVAGNLDYNTVITGRIFDFNDIYDQFHTLFDALNSRLEA